MRFCNCVLAGSFCDVVWSPLMTPRLKQKKVQVPPNPNLNPSQKSKLYPPVGPLLLFTSDECTV